MKYNEKVMNMRVATGKELAPEVRERRENMNAIWMTLSDMQKARAKLIYGLMLVDGETRATAVADRLGVGQSSIYKLMEQMVKMSLLSRTVLSEIKKPAVVYKAYADAELPSEWDIEEVMKAAREYKETVPQEASPQKAAHGKAKEPKTPRQCVLAKALEKDLHIDQKDVPAYKEFVEAMAKVPANNGELQAIVKELIEFAQRRVREAKITCPACGGRVERMGPTGAHCTKCHTKADAGDFEGSLLMISVLRKRGMK